MAGRNEFMVIHYFLNWKFTFSLSAGNQIQLDRWLEIGVTRPPDSLSGGRVFRDQTSFCPFISGPLLGEIIARMINVSVGATGLPASKMYMYSAVSMVVSIILRGTTI